MSNERRNDTVKIMVFGTFDGLHAGHLDFFKQTRGLLPKKSLKKAILVVSIARNKNVKKIKGQFPRLNEKKRMELIKKCKLVDKVVLAGLKNHLPHIIKEKPSIIALGYDQKEYVKNLKKDLQSRGLKVKIVRLRPHKAHVYKNHLLNVAKFKR